MDGVAGLAKIGVKDLSYKMVFIASSVHAGDSRFGFSSNLSPNEEEEENREQDINKLFTLRE